MHARLKGILDLDLVQQFAVLVELFHHSLPVGSIVSVQLTLVDGDFSIEFVASEGDGSVAEVAKVSEQLIVVLGSEVAPLELCVLHLGAVDEQVVSPHFRRNSSLSSIISEDAGLVGLGELDILVVEEFGG